ncbi:YhjD/YihY/BrkB family envelope integrity protein [Kitasatospora viridis]|uniref:Membrane protein n=1 Tax=Kitasatospora viridis TaxID=281105 RepID=A0A561TWB6_9ACTN|nr:YhjD/YihY/BrkB family envelope integrity protein [Kitasatospora viridis]TWF91406.1 membrane protein [Kitasatospora viridis]
MARSGEGPAGLRASADEWRRLVRRTAFDTWRLGRQVELLERSMAFAALCFVTLVPLLVVIAAASPIHGDGVADWITDALGLSSRASRPVRELFVSRRQVLTTTTGFGLAALAVFGVSLMASMQRAMERIWHLRPAPWHAAWRQVLGLAGLVGYILVAAWSGLPWPHTVQPYLRICATVLGGLALFWWLPRLLLFKRVRWRALLPGSVATMAALAGLRVFSQLVFAPLIVSNALSYGAVGTVLVVQSWLVGVGFTVYAGAVLGRVVGPGPERLGPELS